jgi:1,4-alpha-glucan branching enzyme
VDRRVGKLALVFHAHLPYVLGHGAWPHGTDWLYEAAAGSYIPLLDTLFELADSGVSPKVTIGITPVLAEQLADESFKGGFDAYLEQQIKTAGRNIEEFIGTNDHERAELALFWLRRYEGIAASFHTRYERSLTGAFRRLADSGGIEIVTSAATHAYLPLLLHDESVAAQISEGLKTHERIFGSKPRGFWLPECGYRPGYRWRPPIALDGISSGERLRSGIDEVLSGSGIEYTVIDSHLLGGGQAIGAYADRFDALKRLKAQYEKFFPPVESDRSPYSIYRVDSSGVAADPIAVLTRDPRTGWQVWSRDNGYPGDSDYLEFHKKHFPGGLRYWRVSEPGSDLAAKGLYDPQRALAKASQHAEHFARLVEEILAEESQRTGAPAVLCAPYDAELFGHWWFEGPEWLGALVREIAKTEGVDLAAGSECLDLARPADLVPIAEGSWGEGGFHWIWLNESTEWVWRCVYSAEERMRRLVNGTPTHGEGGRILRQAARELFLLQSSDWPFLITTWSARDYAENRVRLHSDNFNRLCDIAETLFRRDSVTPQDWDFAAKCEDAVRLFPDLSLDSFRLQEPPKPG